MKIVCIVSVILKLFCVLVEAWVDTKKVFYMSDCQARYEKPDPKALNKFHIWETFFDKINDFFTYAFLLSFGLLVYQSFRD